MWSFIFKKGGPLFCFCFLSFCQPMHYEASLGSAVDSDLRNTANQGVEAPARSGEEEFKEAFTSDKLDLVFVLDTGPDMEVFYQTGLFGESFLERFQEYDWRFAYTDMSVDVSKFANQQKEEEETQEPEESGCPVLSGLFLTIGGLVYAQPLISSLGLNNLFDCVSKLDLSSGKDKENSVFANGRFLPFEYDGKKWNPEGGAFLTNSTPEHNKIFYHTMRLGAGKTKASYDAPLKKDSAAYPFSSMVLSMTEAGKAQDAGPSEKKLFFREDSAVVYVLFTLSDFRSQVDMEYFKESLKSFFGSEERLKIIPVTVKSNSSMICRFRFQTDSSADKPLKMENFVKEFSSSSVLSICSRNLEDKLFTEISKSLYPKGFLID